MLRRRHNSFIDCGSQGNYSSFGMIARGSNECY